MHTYKLDAINYKDGEFHVRFIPNSEPIEFIVSGKSAEKFFDALKAIDYKTDKIFIDTCSNKYGNSSDKASIGGDWIECEFESEPEQDKEEPSIVRRIKMGEYNGKPLHWVYLGHYDDETDLFLSEDIICRRRFDPNSNDWFNSELAKWLSCEFTEKAFLPSEYRQLVPFKYAGKGTFGHKVFLLSKDEYEKYQNKIPNVDGSWWLRSQGYNAHTAAYVIPCGTVCIGGYILHDDYYGVRPALRLRRS